MSSDAILITFLLQQDKDLHFSSNKRLQAGLTIKKILRELRRTSISLRSSKYSRFLKYSFHFLNFSCSSDNNFRFSYSENFDTRNQAPHTTAKARSAQKVVTPESANDIAVALNDFEPALRQALLYEPCLQTVIRDLQDASVTLAAFIYTCNVAAVKSFSLPKSLVEKLAITYSNILIITNSYQQPGNNVAPIKLLSLNKICKTLNILQQQLSVRYAGSATYELLSSHINVVTAGIPIPFHNWLWWSHFYHHAGNSLHSNKPALEELLIHCGFNCPAFISMLTGELMNSINLKDSFQRKISIHHRAMFKI